ncbi:MAG: DUF3515 domain-containing protein [Microlunatus sp.]|nr:DUF3515 domain-containing protein [Microlunatus sp.]
MLLVAACSGPADVTAPTPSGAARTICRNLISHTPDVVDGQQRREITRPSPYTAAWGNPAITLSCGVPKPPGLNAASECFEVDGVGWFSEQRSDGYRFTTIGRRVYAQVLVPKKYVPSDPLVDLAKAISDHVPVVRHCV